MDCNVMARVLETAHPGKDFDLDSGQRSPRQIGLGEQIVMIVRYKIKKLLAVTAAINDQEGSGPFILGPSSNLLPPCQMALESLLVEWDVVREGQPNALQCFRRVDYFGD